MRADESTKQTFSAGGERSRTLTEGLRNADPGSEVWVRILSVLPWIMSTLHMRVS